MTNTNVMEVRGTPAVTTTNSSTKEMTNIISLEREQTSYNMQYNISSLSANWYKRI